MSDGSWYRRRERRRSPLGHGSDDGPLPTSLDGHVDDLVAGFALGALEASERERVERHRRVCPHCDRLSTEAFRVVGLLPFAVPASHRPPPDLKPAILARVDHTRRAAAVELPSGRPVSPRWRSARPSLRVGSPPPSVPIVADDRVSPSRLRGWGNRASAVLVLPLVFALVASMAWAVNLRSEGDEDEARANSFGAMLEAMAGDGEVVQLWAGPAAPGAKGYIVSSADGKSARLFVRAGEALAGSRFGLFTVGGSKTVPLVVVDLDERGRDVAAFAIDGPLSAYRRFNVKAMTDDGPAGLGLWGRPTSQQGTPTPGGVAPVPTEQRGSP